jgi:hypothetical protein
VSGWTILVILIGVASLLMLGGLFVIGGINLSETNDIENKVNKIKKATVMANPDAADAIENAIQDMVDELGNRMEALDQRSSLNAVASQLQLLGAQIRQLSAQQQAVNEAVLTAAAGSKTPATKTADDARKLVRNTVDAYNAAVRAGTQQRPSDADLRRLNKLIQAAVDDGELPDPDPETGSDITAYQQAVHASGQAKRAAPSAPITVPADYDVDYDNDGVPDFAVVHLTPESVLPPLPYTPWDIPAGTQIVFAALPDGDSYTMSRNSGVPMLSTAGHAQILDFTDFDDGFAIRALGHSFSFNQTAWNSVFVNTDGALTFGASSADSSNRGLSRFFKMPPVISAMFMDLDLTCNPAGGVWFKTDAVSSVFTWLNAVHFDREAQFGCPQTLSSNFQMILYATGSIEFRYGVIDSAAIAVAGRSNSVGFSGIGQGKYYMAPVNYVNFSSFASPQTVTIGSAVEAWNFATTRENILRTLALDKFYLSHPKNYDTVMSIYHGWGARIAQSVEGAVTFYSALQAQTTTGLGRQVTTSTEFGTELEQFVNLRGLEFLGGLTVQQMLEPAIVPILSVGGWYGVKVGINASSGITPVSAPTFPLSMSLVDKGLNTGYSYETARSFSGPFQQASFVFPFSVFNTITHELTHRWNAFNGYRYPNASQWGPNFNKLMATDLGHPNPFIDLRVDTDPATSPWSDSDANYAPKRPRGDPMPYSTGHMTQLIPNPAGGSSFVDAMDPTIVYPDTPQFNMTIAYELCRLVGKDLWVHTPQSLQGSLSVKSLAFAGIISYRDVLNKTMFYVENPVSPYAAFGYTTDLSTLAPSVHTTANCMLACGTKRTFTMADIVNLTDVRRSAQVQAAIGPISAANAARAFGPREPLIGDEGDTIDPAVDAAYPQLRARYNLDACPIVNDPLCNSPALTPGKRDAICVDIKATAPVVWVRPGQTLPNNAINDFALVVELLRQYVPEYLLSSYGARGKVGDTCYLPKYVFSVTQLVH